MNILSKLFVVAVLLFILISCQTNTDNNNEATSSNSSEVNMEDYTLPGASIITFGPDNVLFVGDSKSSVIHALSTEATELKEAVPYNLWSIDKKIAEKLGINPSDVVILDMKIHPVSQEAYISVKRGYAPDAKSVIAIVSPKDGSVSLLNVTEANHTKVDILAPATETPDFWGDIPSNTLTITDMDYHKGNLYISGLTNGEFASTLRVISYPFDGTQTKVAGIEMFHAVHTQKETRAPIRSMIFHELDGEETLIASYTCSPLVTMPSSEIKEGNHIKTKTVAELGFGNVPIDMLIFDTQDFSGNVETKLLITNKMRSASLISLKDLAKANKGEGLTRFTQGPEGLPIFPVPLAGVMHIDNQNPKMLTTLRRNIDNGHVDLLTQLKGSFFRLSDFINEYDFADFEYPKGAEGNKAYHDMARAIEGYPDITNKMKE